MKKLDLMYNVVMSIKISDSLMYCLDIYDRDNLLCSGEENRLIVFTMTKIQTDLIMASSVWGIRILNDEEMVVTISDDGFVRKFSYSIYDVESPDHVRYLE